MSDEYVDHFIKNHGYYRNPQGEENIIKTIIKFINEHYKTIIIDGGFNCGSWSSFVLGNTNPNLIIGYELSKKTYEFNKKRIRSDKIILKHKGLYKEKKKIRLNDTEINDQGYNIEDNIGSDFEVELVKLDDDIKEYINNYDFIVKIDIEGSEFDAIKGMERLLKNKKITALQWEYHNAYKNGITLKQLIEYISINGYNIFIIGHDNLLRIDGRFYKEVYDIKNESGIYEKVIKNCWDLNKNKKIPKGRPECINCIAIRDDIYQEIKNKNIIKVLSFS